MKLEKKTFAWFDTNVGGMYASSFIKIHDDGLQIVKKFVELTWDSLKVIN